MPRSRTDPRFAQDGAVRATAEALIERLARAARSRTAARIIVAHVLAVRAGAQERPMLAAIVAGDASQPRRR